MKHTSPHLTLHSTTNELTFLLNDNCDSDMNILGKQGETKTAHNVGICPIGKVKNKIFNSCTQVFTITL